MDRQVAQVTEGEAADNRTHYQGFADGVEIGYQPVPQVCDFCLLIEHGITEEPIANEIIEVKNGWHGNGVADEYQYHGQRQVSFEGNSQ